MKALFLGWFFFFRCSLFSAGFRWLTFCRLGLRLISCSESWRAAWVRSTLLTVCLFCCTRSGQRQKIYAWNKKQKQIILGFFFFWKVFKLKPVSFLYFYHSSSQTDLITWLRSDICSCWDGGDFATMPALLRSFIPIIRLPCVNEQHDLAVF